MSELPKPGDRCVCRWNGDVTYVKCVREGIVYLHDRRGRGWSGDFSHFDGLFKVDNEKETE